MDPKMQQQIDLEKECLALGRDRFLAQVDHLNHRGDSDCTKPAQGMVHRLLQPVADGIVAFRQEQAGRKVSVARQAITLTEALDEQELAYIILRRALSCVSRQTTLTSAALLVGTAILEEVQMKHWAEVDPEYYKTTMQASAKHKQAGGKRRAQRGMQRIRGVEMPNWTKDARVHVGAAMLNLLVDTTGMWQTPLKREGRKTVRYFLPTQALADWLSESLEQLAGMTPLRMPMVVCPAPWSNPHDGGYVTELGGQVSLVKTRNKGYINALESVDMPEVYDSINAMQSTAWRVNQQVLDVAKALWDTGATVGKLGHESLPPREPQSVPAIPAQWEGKVPEWREADMKGYKLWASKAAAVHDGNDRQVSRRVAAAATIGLADRFRAEDEIFYPHQLDFRGRAYPIPAYLSPQGADLSRGLLTFAEGKPITERGIYWLRVHIANTFGVDKVPFDERVAWTEENEEGLWDSAVDPLDPHALWRQADDPFQALAGCFELVRVLAGGPETLSHLPISMDGSCNGLQNFSSLLADEIGGTATNLVPSDRPQDIYRQVADVVARKISEAAVDLDENAVIFDGFITRALVKQPCMTYCYGATKAGMRSQLEDAIRRAGNPMEIETRRMWASTRYLAGVVYDAIGEVVIAACEAMDWLQSAASIVTKGNCPIHWTAPSGFPVLQEYRKLKGRKLKVHYGGQRIGIVLTDETGLDTRRQKAGIAPNFVHSLDASHMMSTVNWCSANGIEDFAMVHDSYGVHACHVDTMNAALRTAFVEMYKDNLLSEFADELQDQLTSDTKGTLPELPAMGDLDLEAVHESQYFFA